MLRIIRAETDDHYDQARGLFLEYAGSLDFDIEFQGFNKELASLPGAYAPPSGCIFLAEKSRHIIGCVALRKIGESICEMKRLYVRSGHRREKVGKALAERVIKEARGLDYKSMRLDTVASMKEANALYMSLGFRPIDAYCYNPLEKPKYYELRLR